MVVSRAHALSLRSGRYNLRRRVAVFAAGATDDHERQQDRYRQCHGHKSDRCLHGPIAMPIIGYKAISYGDYLDVFGVHLPAITEKNEV